jgi:serine/threonine protein kinase
VPISSDREDIAIRVCPAFILTSHLALTPGARLGVYQITAPLGEGGMGQVYRATDTTLGRQVAIKILPDAFAQDPERLARFEREARTLASLNHPHIAAIYGFEKSAGVYALVMELVEGEDLSQRIAGGAIPIDEALPIARQIADALEAAHELGIVHRDLKPANVKVRGDGTVKVLDFGLAKAGAPGAPNDSGGAAAVAAHSPTFTSPAALTMGGAILGTAAYMAPEQARGKAVDKRADIWASGAAMPDISPTWTGICGRSSTTRTCCPSDCRADAASVWRYLRVGDARRIQHVDRINEVERRAVPDRDCGKRARLRFDARGCTWQRRGRLELASVGMQEDGRAISLLNQVKAALVDRSVVAPA